MKKLAIFPFIYEYRELYMYSKYLKKYSLSTCVTLNSVDTQCITKILGKDSSVVISQNFEKAIEGSDVVLYMYSRDITFSRAEYLEKIKKAIRLGKEILLSQECYEYLSSIIKEVLSEITILGEKEWKENTILKKEMQYLKNIDVPAIGIMGLGQYCNKFCTELEISQFFRSKGYKVMHLGSKDYVELFEGRSLPKFVFDKSDSVTTRILKWNQYLFEICNKEHPDLLVIGMPGGIMPLNNKILNDYGEVPFILANALNIDVGILCSFFYEQIDEKYFTEYRNYCRYKMNCQVDFINMSNTSCRFNLDSQESILEYLHYKKEISNNTVITGNEEQSLQIYNILTKDSCDKLLTRVYDQLTSGVYAF